MICYRLLAQAKLGDQRNVAGSIFGLQVVQQLAAAAHHAQQTAATMVVFRMGFEVRHQLIDAPSQQANLYFWATRVARSAGIGLNDISLD